MSYEVQIEDASNGYEPRNRLKIVHDGQTVDEHLDYCEPEDNSFTRDWNWVPYELERAYRFGLKDAGGPPPPDRPARRADMDLEQTTRTLAELREQVDATVSDPDKCAKYGDRIRVYLNASEVERHEARMFEAWMKLQRERDEALKRLAQMVATCQEVDRMLVPGWCAVRRTLALAIESGQRYVLSIHDCR